MGNEIQSTDSQNFGFNFLGNTIASGETLEYIGGSYALSSILLSAVELNLFDCLVDAPKTCEQIATEIQVSVDGLERLAIALTAMELLKRDSMGNYHNTPAASTWLTTSSPQSMTSSLLFHKRCYDLFGNLTEAIKSGKQQIKQVSSSKNLDRVNDYYRQLEQHPEEYFIFLEAMNRSSIGIGAAMPKSIDFSNIQQIIDLGAGGGQVSLELAEILPHLSIAMVDLPIACQFIQQRISTKGLQQQVKCIPGNLFDDLSAQIESADAVILSGVLADWGVNARMQILHQAHNLLKPGGLLIVSETLFNEQKTGPLQPAILSLCMLLAMQGNNFTPSQIESIIDKAGFGEIRFCLKNETGVRDLIIAQKPLSDLKI
ncbi:class I SAM-dependent methyltransferase [Chamaesiphon minutus]|uniref:Methylase involved in ubiquinone/menaquinone biosynthesis n=1 Tax=Chamaesiphon minutus (strain ATCC 27169 / PCC 6605) TaxID=1173020 RepID=K9ULI7_CHAP6|nr:class I SAM-dependent methyltransferase [Chamaesiphon minutus]AFY95276.1 methylase involved in ubiquinone/menaquinone biosynthesis [Chamaesiphon minutus PCC 6605]